MRKNINKLVAFAIGVSVMSGSIMPVFAEDTIQNVDTITNVQTQANQKPVLTLDDAIKSAISISDTLQLDTKKITYQDNVNDINEELDDYTGVSGDKEDFNDDTREATADKVKQQRDFDEDVLIQKVIQKYNDIVTNQMKIDKAAKALEIKKKELNDTKLKKSLGIITSTDLKTTELEIQNLQNTQKSSENALKDAEYSFKVLTGKDITKYSLEQDIAYETLKIDGSIDNYLDNAIDKYLKYREQILKLKKDYYYDSDNKVTEGYVSDAKTTSEAAKVSGEPILTTYGGYTDAYKTDYDQYEKDLNAYTNAVSSRLAYLANKLSVDEDQTNLDKDKKNFKDQLRTLYTNLLTAEDNINYMKQNIELNNKQLSNAKLKCDLGLITKSDYNNQVLSSLDLDIQLRSYINNYNTLKEEIKKPWIAFS